MSNIFLFLICFTLFHLPYMKKLTSLLIGGITLISLAACTYTNKWTPQLITQPQVEQVPTSPTSILPEAETLPTLPTSIPTPTPIQVPTQMPKPTTSNNTNKKIDIKNLKFTPNNITITAGTKVTWTNQDDVTHTITSDDGVFNQRINANETSSYTFTKAGTYNYHCTPHPSMVGTIIVQ